jgi:hypothetical protein
VDHAKHLIEPTFNLLASNHIERNCLKSVAAVTPIPSRTLNNPRLQLLVDREWRSSQHWNPHRRSLMEDQEAEVVQEIQGQYLGKGRDGPSNIGQVVARKMWRGESKVVPAR